MYTYVYITIIIIMMIIMIIIITTTIIITTIIIILIIIITIIIIITFFHIYIHICIEKHFISDIVQPTCLNPFYVFACRRLDSIVSGMEKTDSFLSLLYCFYL